MISRLDRLFMLLDSSASTVTKKAAASQIGDIQQQHPGELQTLLTKVQPYLHNSNWDTRIAAGHAIESIIKNVPSWNPQGQPLAQDEMKPEVGQIRLVDFSIQKVMEKGMDLLACEGNQYEVDGKNLNKEEIRQQYLLINKKLGLSSFIQQEATFINDKDLIHKFVSPTPSDKTMSVTEVINCEIASQRKSCKRKNSLTNNKEAASKKIKLEAEDGGAETENRNEWPLTTFCQRLMNDLFHPVWEVRHGAATALREVVKHHGKGAGRATWMTANQLEEANQIWLEDLTFRLICVLALDKLGDFISDQVVAPVRETCAQALGLTVGLLRPAPTLAAIQLLLQLLERPEWEARHGGLLGLKYCLAVCSEMQKELVPLVFEAVFKGLQDPVDDVSAVAAAALLPVAKCLVGILPEVLPKLLGCLWDSLLELDDLTSSTSSIVALLASLLSHLPLSLHRQCCPNLVELVPRLWPFLQHPSETVRQAVLQALAMFSKNEQFKNECLPSILPNILRLLIQQCLQEQKLQILDLTYQVWIELLEASSTEVLLTATGSFLSFWVCLPMLPDKFTLDPAMRQAWLALPKNEKGIRGKKPADPVTAGQTLDMIGQFNIGGKDLSGESPEERENFIIQARIMCCRFLAVLLQQMAKPGAEAVLENLYNLLVFHLGNRSALQRFCVGQVMLHLARLQQDQIYPEFLVNKLLECLTDSVYYDEIALDFTRTQKDYQDFIATLRHYKVPLEDDVKNAITLDQIREVVENKISAALKVIFLKPKLLMELESKRNFLLKMVLDTSNTFDTWNLKVQSSLAGALIALKHLPAKLNPLVRPLMDSIKKEKNSTLQRDSSAHLVRLLELCVDRKPSPNAKILRNLITLYCSSEPPHPGHQASNCILTLDHMQKKAELQCFQRRANTVGRPPRIPEGVVLPDEKEQKLLEVQQQGAAATLVQAASHFGPKLLELLPQLGASMLEPILNSDSNEEELITAFQVMRELGPHLHPSLHCKLESLLPRVGECLKCISALVRHTSARCLGTCAQVVTEAAMELLFFQVLPRLDSASTLERLGSVEAVACVVEAMGLGVVPYLASLIVRLLGRMSDSSPAARLLATHCFASLVQLVPLESTGEVPESLKAQVASDSHFLRQLADPSQAPHYEVPSGLVNATLRPYQQRGVDWLGFLRQYRLHGVLCDDMGLGKTLQSLCLLASEHRRLATQESKEPRQSLVICPPTLTGHWLYEVKKFISPECLQPLHYIGPPQERLKLRDKAKHHNLLIASYDIVRNDIDYFESISWYYCILDEGHIIKNGKTKVSKALKLLKAQHRLILTGTPIQNNVLELWSLFDFLMPGFLGTEKQFTVRFSRPILQSRDAKASSKEQEAGVLAMETLHRQVLPFLLRRKKEDVLKDLPPKIIQDFYCDLSPLQVQLYEDFSTSQAKSNIMQTIHGPNSKDSLRKDPHVFEALQYLRNVCNHPKLVLKPGHPQFSEDLASSLSDIENASKLMALKQLLLDCGIESGNNSDSVVNQHRILIFCQLKAMLDIIENDLFKKHLPKLSYLRLDGSVPQAKRIELAEQFNQDPSIDVFLLTTHIGGLGLNLTGADTVIFVEHDWNPMKDYQAMDRAHRIGQKKVVNIYRLITRGTLEEKIMGLQDFKLKIVNTIITPENAQLQTMATDHLLQLFSLGSTEPKTVRSSSSGNLGSFLQDLPELWSHQQYEQEYNLDSFISLLHR